MVGAGFVDGVVFHPKAKDVRYARTDMGGAYRWDAAGGRWAPMLDWVPYRDLNLMGVESVAVDPNDVQKVFLACGTYTNPSTPDGAILRSSDGGKTFAIARVPIKFGGNENGRGNGERLSVDPFGGQRLLLGTRNDGLWRSDDGGRTWGREASFPSTGGARGAGVVVTLFDPSTKGIAYVAVSNAEGPSLFRTTDGGASWAETAGAPRGLLPTHMVLADDGSLWVTFGDSPGPSRMTAGAVWRMKGGIWTDVTPEKGPFGYAAVSCEKGATIVSTFSRPGGEQIYRSLDGGKTWAKCIGARKAYDFTKAPYTSRVGIHWLFDVEIDPFDPNHAVFTTGYGGHETFDLTNADRGRPVHWSSMAPGIEESVGLALLSPTKGVPLVSAIGDYGGFVHRDLDRPAPEGNFTTPHFGNTTDVAAGDFAPETIVRVGRSSGGAREANLGFSLDGGASWRPPISTPDDAREGHIAVSPDGTTWVWSLRGGAYRTGDYGARWEIPTGLPIGLRVVADRVTTGRFYALDLFGGKLYQSEDGARTFESSDLGFVAEKGDRGDSRGGQDGLYATPGRAGDLWIAAFDGLYHARTSRAFVRLPHVETIHAFGFGKASPEPMLPDAFVKVLRLFGFGEAVQKGRFPALYLVGQIDGERGIFRSDDVAESWTRISDDAHQWGLVLQIAGDPKKYGRVYVGTHGRGVFYGDPGQEGATDSSDD